VSGAREAANRQVLERIAGARPRLVGVCRAGEAIPELKDGQFLHAGPPLEGWERASEVLRASVHGSLVTAGTTDSVDAAREYVERRGVDLRSAQDFGVLATYAGVIGKETRVLVVEDSQSGRRAYAGINEGRGKALRYGANDIDTLEQLRWLETEFADVLAEAVQGRGGIDLFEILEQAIRMGDDGHSRQKAASSLFANAVAVQLLNGDVERRKASEVLAFLVKNELFFLSLAMAAAKCAMTAAEKTEASSIVTCMAFNGVEFGMQVSGAPDRWYVAPVPRIEGQYFEGYSEGEAGRVIGDSEIAETLGLGAFAMAGAPALARYIGGTPAEGTSMTMEMYKITCMEHPRFRIPALEFRGTPFGIDVHRVAETGVTPVFSTGIAHKKPGVGQIGAGWGRAPLEPFEEARNDL